MLKQIFLFCLVMLLATPAVQAQKGPDACVGTWLNADKDAHIRVFKATNGKYYGKIEWLKKDKNDDGTPRRDINNPDEKKRGNLLLGTMIASGFDYIEADNEWANGTIYDSKTGNVYDAYMKIQDDGTLFLKGYLMGMRFVGKSTLWTRVK